ncbi:tripartite tricarboxylate transporter permease [Actibacterium sp. 188UL27-1]|uniref:tripartite tricarboxylate transporter permease n=1 Tax=Actibacterium sp. 188UL27-1 TaxID=2786961 RepID=UPI00195D8F3F|nr:tripartite tricarboxylate transporter permease [Actibacterium sp. 188UL27-1]MBM7069330.1 tripartite tricarboxylate transporter permease [Actibacterium sp. 188UL27-1]
MDLLDYAWAGVLAVFQGPVLFSIFGLSISATIAMVLFGFLNGIFVGATPGLGGPMAMAISLPILISIFGFSSDALLPVMGCLIGIMKGATVGGAVPAILFNTPGTPDAYLTTLDGYPMAKRGEARRALKVAHFSSASGDTFSDLVLILCAPFLATLVERYLDLPEKTALLILSLSFIAAVIGGSVAKGLLSAGLGIFVAAIGTGEDFYPRLSLGTDMLAQGFPAVAVILGVLILGEVFRGLEDLARSGYGRPTLPGHAPPGPPGNDKIRHLPWQDRRPLLPHIARSAMIGTAVGALPGIGSTLAATLGHAAGKRRHARKAPDARAFGTGAPEGIAATEAANSAVSGANLIPVLSLGIPGNAAAVFLILAADSIGGFNPGPAVFRYNQDAVNPELIIAFGLFATMLLANLINWTVGGTVMRSMAIMTRIPKHILLPVVLMLTLTSIYVQETRMAALWFVIGFGILGYVMRRLDISPLPFVIAFILGGRLEETARQAYAATGNDPFFLATSPISAIFVVMSISVIVLAQYRRPTTAS